jgi:hypothetical protein
MEEMMIDYGKQRTKRNQDETGLVMITCLAEI